MSAFDSDAFDVDAFDEDAFDFDSATTGIYRTFAEWINAQAGLTGTTNDRIKQYLEDLGYTGHISDMLFEWLTDEGYSQYTLQDKLYAWSIDNLLI